MNKVLKSAVAIAVLAMLTACGGGGSSGTSSTPTPTPTPTPIASIKVDEIFRSIATTTKSWGGLRRSDGNNMYASLSIFSAESYPFVVNGASKPTASSSEVALSLFTPDGRLFDRWRYKIHYDGALKPTGVGFIGITKSDCFAPTSVNTLPASSNSSGVLMSGLVASDYAETFNAGVYAHYCRTTASSPPDNVEWSVIDGTPYPYFCLTFPRSVWFAKTRACFMSNGAGGFSDRAVLTVLDVDYKTSP